MMPTQLNQVRAYNKVLINIHPTQTNGPYSKQDLKGPYNSQPKLSLTDIVKSPEFSKPTLKWSFQSLNPFQFSTVYQAY